MLELYQSYATTMMMELVEETVPILQTLCWVPAKLHTRTKYRFNASRRRLTMVEAIEEYVGIDFLLWKNLIQRL